MSTKDNLDLFEGEHCSPSSVLMASRKWNPVRIDMVPMVIPEHEYKRNVDEMGGYLYKFIESQVQRQSKEVSASEPESTESKDSEKDKAA